MKDRIKAVWPLALIVLLAAGLMLQTLRIEGFRMGHVKAFGADFWIVDLGGFKPALVSCTANRAAIIAAQVEAGRLQAAVNEDEERRTAANAKRSNAIHAQDLARALAAGRSYADSHRIAVERLRPEGDRGPSSDTAAAAESGGAEFSENLPAGSFVAVSDPDLQACTTSVTYAVGAHNWAITLDQAPALTSRGSE